MQLELYLEHIPREAILVATSEDLRDRRAATLDRIWRFLGVDPDLAAPAAAEEFNRTAGKQTKRPTVRRVQESAGYQRLGGIVPEPLKRRLRRALTVEVDSTKATVSPTFRLHLERLLRDDVRRLRTFLGDGFTGWGIA